MSSHFYQQKNQFCKLHAYYHVRKIKKKNKPVFKFKNWFIYLFYS